MLLSALHGELLFESGYFLFHDPSWFLPLSLLCLRRHPTTVAWDEPDAKVPVPFHEPEEVLFLIDILNSNCLVASIIWKIEDSNWTLKGICSCSVGIVLPVYSTFKAIETGNRNEQHKWLLYWAGDDAFRNFTNFFCFANLEIAFFSKRYWLMSSPQNISVKLYYMSFCFP